MYRRKLSLVAAVAAAACLSVAGCSSSSSTSSASASATPADLSQALPKASDLPAGYTTTNLTEAQLSSAKTLSSKNAQSHAQYPSKCQSAGTQVIDDPTHAAGLSARNSSTQSVITVIVAKQQVDDAAADEILKKCADYTIKTTGPSIVGKVTKLDPPKTAATDVRALKNDMQTKMSGMDLAGTTMLSVEGQVGAHTVHATTQYSTARGEAAPDANGAQQALFQAFSKTVSNLQGS